MINTHLNIEKEYLIANEFKHLQGLPLFAECEHMPS